MTAGEIRARAAMLEAQARALAGALQAAGVAPDARDEDRVVGELAGLVVRIAQQRATTVSADQVGDMQRSLRELEADLREGSAAELRGVRTVAAAFDRADQAVGHALARVELHRERAMAQLAGLTLAAWQCAVVELEMLAPRPPASGC